MSGPKKKRPRKWKEVIPFSVELPMRPGFDPATAHAHDAEQVNVTGFESTPTNMAEAERNRVEISEAYRQRYLAGHTCALDELLDISPRFIREGWVQEAFAEQKEAGTFMKRTLGRPKGASKASVSQRLRIVYLAEDLVKQTHKPLDQIFHEMSERGLVPLSYERIKQLYYQTREDARLRPILLPNLALRRIEPMEE